MNLQLFALKNKAFALANDGGGSSTKKEEEKKTTTNTTKSSGYDPYSITDYLKSQGQDSSYSARAKLAEQYGIQGYKGSGEQNTLMLKMLRDGVTPSNTAKPEVKPKATPKAEPEVKPKAEKKEEPVADAVAPVVTAPVVTEPVAPASGINGVSADTMQALNTPFTAPTAFNEAMGYLTAQSEKITSGRTSYTDQIQSMMSKIQNRDKFSYDVDTDMLFQQALASSMASGKQAMQDTMGQASALTGGYASTYAQSAGNQAYNAYIQDAYNNLPEYYQMALEAYNMEGQDMYNQLAMLSDADATEYGRTLDAYNIKYTEAQDIYNRAFNEYQGNWNNNYNLATLGNSDYWSGKDEDYRRDTLQQDADQFATSTYWDNYWNEKDNTYKYDALESDDAYRRDALAQDDRHFGQEMTYKNDALAQDKALSDRDYLARYDLNGDNVVNEADKALEDAGSKKIDQKHMTGAVDAMNGGGIKKLNEFLNSLSGIYSEAELEDIAEYAGAYSTWIDTEADYDWKMIDDGGWKLGKLDDTAKVSLNDNEMTIQALYEKLLEQGMTKKEAKDYIVALQNKLGI